MVQYIAIVTLADR